MLSAKCSICSKTLRWEDSQAGQTGRCDQCGASVRVPGKAVPPATRSKASETAAALEEAMRATEGKEEQKHRRPTGSSHQVFDVGGGKASKLADALKAPAVVLSKEQARVTPRQIKMIGGAVVVLVIAVAAYLALTPSRWEADHCEQVLAVKTEADQLATEGKPLDAYRKYQQVVLMTSGQSLTGKEILRAVEEARVSRDQLLEQHRAEIDKARIAAARQ